MEIADQLSIFLENRPGVLASVSSALAEAGVNLRALCVSDSVDHAVVRLVPSDPALARDVLERGGALVVETEVLVLTLPDEPGALADVARRFAATDVNIEYSYGSGGAADAGILVMRVSDMERAKKALA
jgi:hypothetical protein